MNLYLTNSFVCLVTVTFSLKISASPLGIDIDQSSSRDSHKAVCRTEGPEGPGDTNGKACVFPFKYKGTTYEKCTTVDSDTNVAWCAFDIQPGNEVPQDGKHWNDCNKDCPGAGKIDHTGMDCWNKCGYKEGPCPWCGTDGMCCTRKPGWIQSNGCDGAFGGPTRHECSLPGCTDKWETWKCQTNKDVGYCTGSPHAELNCRKTCGFCEFVDSVPPTCKVRGTATCSDFESFCDEKWSNNPLCASTHGLVKDTCKATCGISSETCKEPINIGTVLWDQWTSWSKCQYTVNGGQRRRFSDPLVPMPPSFDEACMLDAAIDDVIESKTRRKIIIENEFDPLMPRVANVENCIVEDKLPDLCQKIPEDELHQFCSISEEMQKDFRENPFTPENIWGRKLKMTDYDNEPWLYCLNTCQLYIIEGPATTTCFEHQYQCDDHFCLELDAIGNNKPDCVDASAKRRYLPEDDIRNNQRLLIPGACGDGTGSKGGGDYLIDPHHTCHGGGVAKQIQNLPFSNCNQCSGSGGQKQRHTKILAKCSNADSCVLRNLEHISCNKEVIKNEDSCENDGYLEFGEYLPKEVLNDEFLEKWGQSPKTYNEKLLDFIKTFNTQHEAENACQADQNCCGITYSKSLKFTLRNGGIVNKYDGIDRNSEPVILFDKKLWVPEVWGVKSWRKDCFKTNRPGPVRLSDYCSDKKKYCKLMKTNVSDFKNKYCKKGKYVINCTKSCGFC